MLTRQGISEAVTIKRTAIVCNINLKFVMVPETTNSEFLYRNS